MLYARKMVLVPEAEARSAATEQNVPPPAAPVSSFRNIDADVANILSQKNLSDYDKWQKYSNLLNKYLIKFNVQKSKNFFNEDDDEGFERKIEFDENDMEWTPSNENEKQNFVVVKNILEQSGDVNWDAAGNAKVFGEPIGSKINALVSNLVVNNNDQQPPGWGVFVEAVKKLNIPAKYTPNLKKRKMEMSPSKIKYRKLENPAAEKRKADGDVQPVKRFKTNTATLAATKNNKRKTTDEDISSSKRSKIAKQGKKRKSEPTQKAQKRQKLNELIPPNLLKRKLNEDDLDSAKRLKGNAAPSTSKRKYMGDDFPPGKRLKAEKPSRKRVIVSEDLVGGKRMKLELPLKLISKNANKQIRWSSY